MNIQGSNIVLRISTLNSIIAGKQLEDLSIECRYIFGSVLIDPSGPMVCLSRRWSMAFHVEPSAFFVAVLKFRPGYLG